MAGRAHCRRQVLGAQGLPRAGKWAYRGSGEGQAGRRQGPLVRLGKILEAPSILKPGQLVMAQGGQEEWDLVLLVGKWPPGRLEGQNLTRALVTGMGRWCSEECGLETRMVTVLAEAGLRDFPVSRVAQVALTEGRRVKQGCVQGPGLYPEAVGTPALCEGIVPMVVWGVPGQQALWVEVASGPLSLWGLLGRAMGMQELNQGALEEDGLGVGMQIMGASEPPEKEATKTALGAQGL